MKKSLVLLAALAVFAATPAFAEKGYKMIGIQGGASLPLSDLGDIVGTGWNASVLGSYNVATNCALGIEVGYHAWTGKDNVDLPGGGTADLSDLKISAIQATAFTTYRFPTSGKVSPYLKGGVGLYNVKEKVDLPAPDNVDQSTSKLGFNVGGGLDFTASPDYTIGLVAAYHMIMLDDEDYPNLEGDKFNPSIVTVGLQLGWGMGAK